MTPSIGHFKGTPAWRPKFRRSQLDLDAAAILVAQFVIPMSITGTAIALPPISDDLGTAAGPLQWVVNGFNVPFALSAVLWGAAADRIG